VFLRTRSTFVRDHLKPHPSQGSSGIVRFGVDGESHNFSSAVDSRLGS